MTPRLQPRLASFAYHPIQRFNLAFEASDILPVAPGVGRYDAPFRLGFEGARLERDLLGRVRHAPTMRADSPICHLELRHNQTDPLPAVAARGPRT